jgi:hypothetical protein
MEIRVFATINQSPQRNAEKTYPNFCGGGVFAQLSLRTSLSPSSIYVADELNCKTEPRAESSKKTTMASFPSFR